MIIEPSKKFCQDHIAVPFPGERVLSDGLDWTWAFLIYAEVPGFPGYVACNDGRIWSLNPCLQWKLLSPTRMDNGYLGVSLYRDGKEFKFVVHRLILETFLGQPPEGKPFACHFPDRNPENNNLNNLRWASQKENMEHARTHGTRPPLVATESERDEIRILAAMMVPRSEISRRFNLNPGQLSLIIHGPKKIPGMDSQESRKARNLKCYEMVIPLLEELISEGMSQRQIADEMNRLKLRTKLGNPWCQGTVGKLIRRINSRKDEADDRE